MNAAACQTNTYKRRQPEQSLLYRTIAQHLDTFIHNRAAEGRELPAYVLDEFRSYLRCGILEHGFVRVFCATCHHEFPVALSCKKRGFCPSCCGKRMAESAAHLVDNVLPKAPYRQWVITLPFALRYWAATNKELEAKIHKIIISSINHHYQGRAVALGFSSSVCGSLSFIHRMGSALNFHFHYHVLFLDGVYVNPEKPQLVPITDLNDGQVETVLTAIAQRIIRHLQKKHYLDENGEVINAVPPDDLFSNNDALTAALSASVQGRIAFGPRTGEKVRSIGKGFGYQEEIPLAKGFLCCSMNGFSLHAASFVRDHDRRQLEKLIKYISRPPLAEHRLGKAADGQLTYSLKTPRKNGVTAILLSPEELLEKLTTLIPPPKSHSVRWSGIFASSHSMRPKIVLQPSIKKGIPEKTIDNNDKGAPRSNSMWAKLLSRCFGIDLTLCPKCGGNLQVLCAVVDPHQVARYLKHIGISYHAPPTLTPVRDLGLTYDTADIS